MISLIIGILLVISVKGDRLYEEIYSSVEGSSACFRRLNGTHQTGCSSSDKGAVGVIHTITNANDAQWIITNSTAGPYVAVVSTELFGTIIHLLLQNPTNIAGVVVYENNSSAQWFSEESRCPNEYSSAKGSQCSSSIAGGITWNDHGTGILRQNIPFPIFFLPKSQIEEIEKINNCYERFNKDKDNQHKIPLCSIQLNSFMMAAVNSEVCMRRSASTTFFTPTKMCDPLGDNNIYYSLFPRGKVSKLQNRSVTLVTARIDSASLFDGIAPGGASSVVGLVTFITAASTLARMIPIIDAQKYDHNILWTLLNGESFDYIGSQRIAYDFNLGKWPPNAPLTVPQIKLHVELGQLGGALKGNKHTSEWPINAFVPVYKDAPIEINNFLVSLNSNAKKNVITFDTEFTANLPPSSMHSFRRILDNITEPIPELLLVDHKNSFSNVFYQSVLDNSENIVFNYKNISIDNKGTFLNTDDLIQKGTMKDTDTQVKIARLANTLARTLYSRILGDNYSGSESTSAHLVDEMLYCFMSSQACRLLFAADYANSGNNDDKVPEKLVPMYVGVAGMPNSVTTFAGHLLALLAGNQVPGNFSTCAAQNDADFNYYWLRGFNHSGVCIQTTMNFTQALSPAFIIQDYDWSSGFYSTWTESVWQTMSARMFVTASGLGARVAAIVGGLVTLVALIVTFWLKKHADVIFSGPPSPLTVNDNASGILRSVNC